MNHRRTPLWRALAALPLAAQDHDFNAAAGLARMKGEFTPNAGGPGASSISAQALADLSLSCHPSNTVAARLDWDGTRVRMAMKASALNLVSASALPRF